MLNIKVRTESVYTLSGVLNAALNDREATVTVTADDDEPKLVSTSARYVLDNVAEGQKILTIKSIRNALGWSLIDAKNAVDAACAVRYTKVQFTEQETVVMLEHFKAEGVTAYFTRLWFD